MVPQGGNTGLVGGSNPVFDEVILNLGEMNRIKGFDPNYGIVTAESGAILQDLNTYLREKGYEMPLDIKSRAMC